MRIYTFFTIFHPFHLSKSIIVIQMVGDDERIAQGGYRYTDMMLTPYLLQTKEY